MFKKSLMLVLDGRSDCKCCKIFLHFLAVQPGSQKLEQLAKIRMSKLRHCQPIYRRQHPSSSIRTYEISSKCDKSTTNIRERLMVL